MKISRTDGQGPKQFAELGYAFLLSPASGLEREMRHKSAGLRTYAVVGTTNGFVPADLQVRFTDVLAKGLVALDPSHVAAEIVIGIGFIGGGFIFVRGDRVNRLTTAATAWLVTGVGWRAARVCPCLLWLSPALISP